MPGGRQASRDSAQHYYIELPDRDRQPYIPAIFFAAGQLRAGRNDCRPTEPLSVRAPGLGQAMGPRLQFMKNHTYGELHRRQPMHRLYF